MKKSANITPRYLTEAQTQVYTSFSHDKLLQLRQDGLLPYIQTQPGGSIIYDREDIDNFMLNHKYPNKLYGN